MATESTSDNPGAALVTGGAGGIGWAICQRLADAGYRVIIADLDADAARDRAADLGTGHAALGVDLTDPQAAAALVARAAELSRGGLRLVVNNAGMTDSGGHTLCAMPQAAFERIVALNLTAVERICMAAQEALKPGGVVINIASGAAWRPLPLRGPYSATKAALAALTKALGPAFAARGLRIGGVAPGYTLTPLVEELHRTGQLDLDAVAAGIPLGRLAMPHDIADAVAFMASDAGAVMAGQTLLVDGGSAQGQAPRTGAPEPGTQAGPGEMVWLGAPDDATGFVPASFENLSTITPLGAVIDATHRHGGTAPADVLTGARDTARACAAHPSRSRDFALVFVFAPGDTPLDRAAQAAQAMLARTLALEWAHAGLRVNAVAWRGGDDKDLAALCRFLAGPGASYITGQTITAGQLPDQAGRP
ncbi:MAG: SDR family oxidoreductase [Pararhodobacter sp.]|nr:SDR family oxidoreductase [Pararhodobacter sp.]